MKNSFMEASMEASNKTKSGNGAIKLHSTNNSFVDQFGSVSNYLVPRTIKDITNDFIILWAENKRLAIAFIFYLRMITRKVILPNGSSTETIQMGPGLKHEAIIRYYLFFLREPKIAIDNLLLFVSAGSWKDVFELMRYIVINKTNNSNINPFIEFVIFHLVNPAQSELIKKYLPQIKSNSKVITLEERANNIIAKTIAKRLFDDDYSAYKKYRQMKSSGTGHEWQQLISQKKFERLEFDKIHGRALSLLVRGKFLFNNNLSEIYSEWIGKKVKNKEAVKYTGFPHELLTAINYKSSTELKTTTDLQFLTLLKEFDKTNWLVVQDVSGSMTSPISTSNSLRASDVCKSIAIFFSYLFTGYFKDYYFEFNKEVIAKKWQGNTPTDRWLSNITQVAGNTDFIKIAYFFRALIKEQAIPEREFPTGVICISDGEFDRLGVNNKTNVQKFFEILRETFSKSYCDNFKLVIWDIPNTFYAYNRTRKTKFETKSIYPNVFYFGGFDPVVINFLKTQEIQTSEDVLEKALNQEVMSYIEFEEDSCSC